MTLAWPAAAAAQRRARVRPAVAVRGVHRPVHRPILRPFVGHAYFWGAPPFWGPYWSPFWGSPFVGGPFWGGPFWGGPWGWPVGPELAAARLEVSPRDTEAYLDGRLVGVADDFDGRFQRLRVPPGQHELTLFREGTRLWTRPVLLTPGGTLHIEHTMVPLAADETAPERARDGPRPRRAARSSCTSRRDDTESSSDSTDSSRSTPRSMSPPARHAC